MSSAFGILPQYQCLSSAQPLVPEIFMKEYKVKEDDCEVFVILSLCVKVAI